MDELNSTNFIHTATSFHIILSVSNVCHTAPEFNGSAYTNHHVLKTYSNHVQNTADTLPGRCKRVTFSKILALVVRRLNACVTSWEEKNRKVIKYMA